jgi:hypothetical protein
MVDSPGKSACGMTFETAVLTTSPRAALLAFVVVTAIAAWATTLVLLASVSAAAKVVAAVVWCVCTVAAWRQYRGSRHAVRLMTGASTAVEFADGMPCNADWLSLQCVGALAWARVRVLHREGTRDWVLWFAGSHARQASRVWHTATLNRGVAA